MAIDKNFVVRNGIEVAENLIVASTSLDAVGLGTTTPSSKVDVAGGITADNILVRSNGITTSLGEFNVGTGGTIISAIPDTSFIGLHTASPTFAVQIDNPTGNSTSFYVKEGDVNINTGGLRVGGASTFTGDVSFGSTATFGDDDRLRFGEDNDLQIYHDGSNSVIEESGPGNLRVNTSNFVLKNAANSQVMVRASQSSGEVELYFDGSEKLSTTGAGVTIFGTTKTQQLNVTGVSTLGVTTATNLTLQQLNVSGVSTFNDNVKINSLTENRIPIIGLGSTIEDDTNLTFDGTQLALGVGLTVTGVSTFAGNIDANGDLDVDGFTELDDVNVSGAITATTFTGNLAGTASTATIATYTSNWILESGDGSNYGISGPGLTGTENDPTFHLTRGEKYKFTNNTGGHPFRIQSTPNGSVGTQYDDGITNNDAGDGTTLLWDVQMDAPNILYYQCTSHGGMGGKIYIGNSGSSIDVDGHTETDTLNVSGLSTFVGLSTFNDGIIIVSGVSTLGVTTATNLTLQQLNVSGLSTLGVTTLTNTTIQQLNVSGVTTLSDLTSQQLNVSGVSTLGVTTLTNTTTQQLNVSGFSTFSDNVKISSLTENRIPIIGAGSTIEDDANFTFDGTQLALGVGLTVTGVSTFAGNIDANGDLDVDGHTELDDLQVSGITTFTNTTENTLGDVDTGSVQLDGGIGVDGNVTVGGALSVTGNSYFVGMVTFAAGTDGNISLGDANTDNVIFNADVNSNIIPNTTSTYDLGSSSQKWRDFYLSGNAGIGSLNVTGVSTLGVTTATNLTLEQLNVSGVSTLGVTTATDVTLQQLNVSGLSTLGVTTATNLTLEQLNVSGVSTLGVTTATNLTLQQLNVSGVSTFAGNIDANGNLDVDGHTELDDLNVSGVSTLGVTTATNLTLQQLNVSGVSTLGVTTATNLTLQQLNVSGVSTFAGNIDANGDLDVDGHTELDDLNVSGVSTLGVTTATNLTLQQLNVSGIITAQSGVDITGGNTKIKGAVETVSVGSYSGDILTLDTELGTLFTHDLQSGSIGIVSITNFPVTSNTFHTVTLLLNQNSTGSGNTTAETGIGTNITLTPDGVSGFNTTPISGFGVTITASITPEDIDIVTFGIHYNGSGTGTPANYKVFITKNGSFRYG